MKNNDLMTAKEVAKELFKGTISADTVRRYARNHELPVIQFGSGRRMVFERAAVISFIQAKRLNIPVPERS